MFFFTGSTEHKALLFYTTLNDTKPRVSFGISRKEDREGMPCGGQVLRVDRESSVIGS